MSRCLLGCAAALTAAIVSASAYAQDPATSQPGGSRPAAQAQTASATVEGCLVREEDVPGRKPNVAERAGVLEDYILTEVKIVRGSAGATGQPRPGGEAVGTAGRQSMYEVEGIDDERLKKFVGQRVQIDGTFENVDRSKARPEAGTPADDLPEIRGTAIRQVQGTCAAPKQ